MVPTDFARHFPDPQGLIYLNSGSVSKTPTRVLERSLRIQREAEHDPTQTLLGYWERLWGVQRRFASFLGARPQDIFFRPNVTLALNEFLMNFPLPRGAEIVLGDIEYGAIANICRARAERDGHRLRTISLIPRDWAEIQSWTPESLLELVLRQLGPDTRLLMLSHVMTGTGLKLPLAPLARELRSRGILFCVDGAHGPGSAPLDFSELDDVDFYGGNIHKWLMGPKGTGFGWVPERHHEKLWPSAYGWTSYESASVFASFADRFAGRMLTSSTQGFGQYLAIDELISFWEELGPQAVFDRLRELGERVDRAMSSWERLTPLRPDLRGPLTTFDLPEHLGKRGYPLIDDLRTQSKLVVMITQVGGKTRLRLSPHIYNSFDEIDRAARILAKAAAV